MANFGDKDNISYINIYKIVYFLGEKKPFLRRFGRGGEDRTPINGFGDRYATIVPHP